MDSLFNRRSPLDWMPRLRALGARCRVDLVDVDAAVEFAVAAWSMVDLVRHERNLPRSFAQDVKRQCPSLAYMQDIATQRKHGEITRYAPQLKTTNLHGGAFSADFSRDFDVSRLELTTVEGRRVLFIDAMEATIRFWETYFK